MSTTQQVTRSSLTNNADTNSRRLDSWKEIAAHLSRTVRTVQRWERQEGLPVRRLVHRRANSVYALTHELDLWVESHGRFSTFGSSYAKAFDSACATSAILVLVILVPCPSFQSAKNDSQSDAVTSLREWFRSNRSRGGAQNPT